MMLTRQVDIVFDYCASVFASFVLLDRPFSFTVLLLSQLIGSRDVGEPKLCFVGYQLIFTIRVNAVHSLLPLF